jgi:hypothetical protein
MPPAPTGRPTPWPPGQTAIYHITHISNLKSMATSGHLHCDSTCAAAGIDPVSIAYADLKARRARVKVRVAQGGTLADYVPFYFAPRSPMLFVIDRGGVIGYEAGQDEVVHLVLSAESIAREDHFVITDGHPVMAFSTQYSEMARLDQVDWPVMRSRYWSDSDQDGDRKRRRQAEFLAWSSVPFAAVRIIGVRTESMAERVEEALAGTSHQPVIAIRPDWYY